MLYDRSHRYQEELEGPAFAAVPRGNRFPHAHPIRCWQLRLPPQLWTLQSRKKPTGHRVMEGILPYLVLMLAAGALWFDLSATYSQTDSVRRQPRAWAGHRGRCSRQATRTADGTLKKAVDVRQRELVRRR